ncbi:MAG TPA: sulfotransferase domain-containing protein [Anaerolineales bacterium]|nr:sulfotransferase domain-containing protein [Anaerolineales bacterium]
MLNRGSIQLRGMIRWKWRRLRTALRYGSAALRRQPIVFGNAIPKSGSKLLFNILRGYEDIGPFVDTGLNEIKPFQGGRPTPSPWIHAQLDALGPGDVRFGYLPWTPQLERRLCRDGWATYLIVRDPRDTVVSAVYYATQMYPGHALHEYLGSLPDMEARIGTIIQGISEGPLRRASVRQHFERFIPWMQQPEVCLVRYERLVQEPEATLGSMLEYLRRRGFAAKEEDAKLISRLRAGMAPSRSETFRKGGAGGWRQHFTEHNREQFEAVAGDLLQVLGYEA